MEKEFQEIADLFEGELKSKNGNLEIWLAYTHKLLKLYLNGGAEKLYEPQDVIHEIITRTLEGTRKWDREKVPCLNTYMAMQIKSVVWNIAKKEKRMIPGSSIAGDELSEAEFWDSKQHLTLEEIESNADTKELLEKCYEILEEDTECSLVFIEMTAGNKNEEIAKKLGIKTSDVTNIKKRLMRKLNRINLN